jgi:hypothetical protein
VNVAPPNNLITSVTLQKAAPKLAKWSKAWNRKCKAANVRATMDAHVKGAPSMNREAHHLTLKVPGKQLLDFSFKGASLDAITDDLLRGATLDLMRAAGLGSDRPTGEKTPAGVPLLQFVPAFEV